MTTPQQKLNEIEQQTKGYVCLVPRPDSIHGITSHEYSDNVCDCGVLYLIARVKQLEASLDRLLKSEVIQGAEFITYSEAYFDAKKALTTLPGEK